MAKDRSAAAPVAATTGSGRLAAAPPQPRTVVVLGDSTAGTIGIALEATAPPGTTVLPRSTFGCGLAMGTWASNDPPRPELPMFPACNESEPTTGQWPALDAQAVADTGPGDVVLFVGGSWECQNILHDGQWSDITEPSFEQYLLGQMTALVAIATAHGARLELTTLPAVDNGSPADLPERRGLYDQLVETVAAEHPATVSVVDLARVLSPNGAFVEYIDGVEVRTADGIHTPAYAPGDPFSGNSSQAVASAFYAWLAPRLWPLILDPSRAPGPGYPVAAR